jgi:hypothetical protein
MIFYKSKIEICQPQGGKNQSFNSLLNSDADAFDRLLNIPSDGIYR